MRCVSVEFKVEEVHLDSVSFQKNGLKCFCSKIVKMKKVHFLNFTHFEPDYISQQLNTTNWF